MKIKNIKENSVIRKAMPYCIAILFYVVIMHLNMFGKAIGSLLGFISPVFFGLVLAYIMDPIVRKIEKSRREKGKKHPRGIAITITVLAIILSLLLLMAAVVPQFVSSLVNFSQNTTSYHSVLQSSVDKIAGKSVDLTTTFYYMDKIMNRVQDYVTKTVAQHSKDVGSGLVTFAVSYILAIYFLIYKEKLQAGTTRLMKLMIK
ncbi:MAG: AI-2E family transporter, partial [Anaerovoracaceae bacterium]